MMVAANGKINVTGLEKRHYMQGLHHRGVIEDADVRMEEKVKVNIYTLSIQNKPWNFV